MKQNTRICFLAPASSAHTRKWCGYFASQGCEVHVISLDDGAVEGATVHTLLTNASAKGSDVRKLGYLMRFTEARKMLEAIVPDVVHAHYATSYGTLAALACTRPYILSVWGSDIYAFPKKSPLHKAMLEYSLHHAALLMSTSAAMAQEAAKYTDRPFEITPFGVDTALFCPKERDHGDDFVIATVKTLSLAYGIDVLLRAIAILAEHRPDIALRARIAGKGSDELQLKRLAGELGIADRVVWLGYISQGEAAKVWADADVGIVPSTVPESFGVAAVEAQACGTPVIVSDTPGLMEATVPGKSALVFSRGNEVELAACIELLHDDALLRKRMAEQGVENVNLRFSYRKCFESIAGMYSRFMATHGSYHA